LALALLCADYHSMKYCHRVIPSICRHYKLETTNYVVDILAKNRPRPSANGEDAYVKYFARMTFSYQESVLCLMKWMKDLNYADANGFTPLLHCYSQHNFMLLDELVKLAASRNEPLDYKVFISLLSFLSFFLFFFVVFPVLLD
jgi:hypothetical protein